MGSHVAGTAPRTLKFAGLLLVLAGLFAMHGLGTHGVSGTGHAAPSNGVVAMSMPMGEGAGPATPSSHGAATGHDAMTPPATQGGPWFGLGPAAAAGTLTGVAGWAHAAPAPGSGSGSGMTMAVLCLAVLVLAAVALVLGLRRRSVLTAVERLPRCGTVPHSRGRDPDPPCLLRLSIQRC